MDGFLLSANPSHPRPLVASRFPGSRAKWCMRLAESEIWPILARKIYSPAKNSCFFVRLSKVGKDNREIKKKKLINIESERVTQMSCLVMEKHTPKAFFLTQPSPSGDWDGRSQSSHIYCFFTAHSSCLNPHENW